MTSTRDGVEMPSEKEWIVMNQEHRQTILSKVAGSGRHPDASLLRRRFGRGIGAGLGTLALIAYLVPPAGAAERPLHPVAAAATVGPVAYAVAVDARAGRVLVVSADLDNRAGGPTGQGRVHILDARTGAPLGSVKVGQGASAITVDARTGHAFVGNAGRLEWYRDVDGSQAYRPIDPSISMLDTRTGTILRTIRLGRRVPYALAVDAVAGRLFAAVGPLPANTPDASGALLILDIRTGALMHTLPLHAMPLASHELALDATTGRVFSAISASDGTMAMQVLNAHTGATVRIVPVGAAIAAITVDETANRVLVATIGGHGSSVGSFDARSGALVRTTNLGARLSPSIVAVDERTGRAIIACTSTTSGGLPRMGAVVTLDVRLGTILRTVPVGFPGSVAVDAQTGHAFVASTVFDTRNRTARSIVHVLDVRSGSLLRNTIIGTASGFFSSVAVAAPTGRAFLVEMLADKVTVLETHHGTVLRTVALSTKKHG
jgi:DNA-binding beta-propeller fold protein YncE